MDLAARNDARVTELALAAGSGDRRALEQFIAETQHDVWRFIAHRAGPARADDLTQETYLRSLGSLARFEGRASARTWLLSIARRVCVDDVRAALARPRVVISEQHYEQDGVADHALEFVEVKLMLAALSEERREALVLTQVLGLSYTEAAAICGCPVGTVRSRVARAREDLTRAAAGSAAAGRSS
jgi:RNA polymerase sigma-70 factor (ECF subfamily)